MTKTRWKKAEELFERAVDLPLEKREAFLSSHCHDAELRAEVASLLAHDARSGDSFLEAAAPSPLICIDIPSEDPLLGQMVGDCRLVRVLGVGGMGVVYEAKQLSPSRTVAVKILQRLPWSRDARRRFDFETRILARLSHPHIAQVYGVGVHEDQPFFVMEYVQGAVPITQYADQASLAIEQRLHLIMQVCYAVHHGHQKGVIHRDLKPGNILVSSDGYVKVIDFGVARSTDSDVATTSMRTDVGQLIGTLQYMSPEQCQAEPLGIDIRSDVYSLGVVLYELLCGRPPYDVSRTTITQAARTICEQPPIPPRQLQRKFHRLLQLLTLKALEKKRKDRYQSAMELARDIRRFLDDEPIDAKPPTAWDRVGRWIARHPVVATTVASATVATLMFLSGYVSFQYAFRTPHEVLATEDGRSVRLLSFNGNPLDGIDNKGKRAVSFAQLVEQTGLADRKSLAVVGFTQRADRSRSGMLSVFDVSNGSFDEPIWTSWIKDAEVAVEPGPSFRGADFQPDNLLCIDDIFPAHPGCELVVSFSHSRSRRSLRIYGLDGMVLYEVWHDGVLKSAKWLAAAETLVVSGENAEGYWEDRGRIGVTTCYPFVVFAIKPHLGERHRAYIRPEPRAEDIAPIWYKAILPASSTDAFDMPAVFDPLDAEFRDGRHFGLHMRYKLHGDLAFSWIMDEKGTIVSRSEIDAYKRLKPKPRPSADDVRLGPLPPIVRP